MPTEDAVRCSRVVKIYRAPSGEVQALQGVDATFRSGSITAVTGPSGSGKSSLLAIVALQDRPTGGDVWIVGQDSVSMSPARLRATRRTEVAWMAQRPTHSLFAHLSALEMLVQMAHLRRADTSANAARERLDRVGLLSRAGARTGQLSGGEQQRLAAASAAIGNPAVIVVDEPTAELDDASAGLVLAEFRSCAQAGSCVVMATHDQRAVQHADRHMHLRHGVLSDDRQGTGPATVAIDASGRLQLPEATLGLFADRRAIVEPGPDGVFIRPAPPQESS
ncbi:MAG: ATP-binding cassette domain-containing protein [Ornithinimicrobium sp.]